MRPFFLCCIRYAPEWQKRVSNFPKTAQSFSPFYFLARKEEEPSSLTNSFPLAYLLVCLREGERKEEPVQAWKVFSMSSFWRTESFLSGRPFGPSLSLFSLARLAASYAITYSTQKASPSSCGSGLLMKFWSVKDGFYGHLFLSLIMWEDCTYSSKGFFLFCIYGLSRYYYWGKREREKLSLEADHCNGSWLVNLTHYEPKM